MEAISFMLFYPLLNRYLRLKLKRNIFIHDRNNNYLNEINESPFMQIKQKDGFAKKRCEFCKSFGDLQ